MQLREDFFRYKIPVALEWCGSGWGFDCFLVHVALVDTLVARTRAWEEERGISFTYDGVPLLAMLDEYAMLRHDREEEKRRMRVS